VRDTAVLDGFDRGFANLFGVGGNVGMRDVGWDQCIDGVGPAKRTCEEARVRGVADRRLCAIVHEGLQVVFGSGDDTNFLALLEQRMRRRAPRLSAGSHDSDHVVLLSVCGVKSISPPHRFNNHSGAASQLRASMPLSGRDDRRADSRPAVTRHAELRDRSAGSQAGLVGIEVALSTVSWFLADPMRWRDGGGLGSWYS
jgi:hypothetical protein